MMSHQLLTHWILLFRKNQFKNINYSIENIKLGKYKILATENFDNLKLTCQFYMSMNLHTYVSFKLL